MTSEARLGAWVELDAVRFRVWAPDAQRVAVVVEGGGEHPLAPGAHGYHEGHVSGGSGMRYRYRLDGRGPLPDPASRYQPEGVHGPSAVIDPRLYEWQDNGWQGVPLERLVTYEMHVGTWTPERTFRAAASRLDALADLGVTAVQLMPIADFPGERNWGYDAVSLFAPARCYGTPEDLRAFVDRAHQLGIAVILDVVYNHFGPDGAYHGQYSHQYFSERHRSLWGAGINLDGPGSEQVREFFIESALHWLREYHVDGFRLDATHALQDDGPRHFLAEYAERVHAAARTHHPPLLIAEDHRNLARLLQPASAGGYGFDGVLADDFHHEVRRLVAGDDEGYYQDYAGTADAVAKTVQLGWEFTGQYSAYFGEERGTSPDDIALPHFVLCLQNHDQVGNRAFGDRLTEGADLAQVRAATTLLLCVAETPMLFMGQEWAASTPFQFFTDHHDELGRAVTEGRRQESRHWSAFRDPEVRAQIPDPQSRSTFEASILRWEERDTEPHASMLRLHRALLALRAAEPAFQWREGAAQHASALDKDSVAVVRSIDDHAAVLVVHLRGGPADLDVAPETLGARAADGWDVLLSTEDGAYVSDAQPIEVDAAEMSIRCRFQRPGAVLLRPRPSEPSP